MQLFTLVSWCTALLLTAQLHYGEVTTLEKLDLLYPDIGIQFKGISHFQTVRDVFLVQIALEIPNFQELFDKLELNTSTIAKLNCTRRTLNSSDIRKRVFYHPSSDLASNSILDEICHDFQMMSGIQSQRISNIKKISDPKLAKIKDFISLRNGVDFDYYDPITKRYKRFLPIFSLIGGAINGLNSFITHRRITGIQKGLEHLAQHSKSVDQNFVKLNMQLATLTRSTSDEITKLTTKISELHNLIELYSDGTRQVVNKLLVLVDRLDKRFRLISLLSILNSITNVLGSRIEDTSDSIMTTLDTTLETFQTLQQGKLPNSVLSYSQLDSISKTLPP